jgi:hypothetical protein
VWGTSDFVWGTSDFVWGTSDFPPETPSDIANSGSKTWSRKKAHFHSSPSDSSMTAARQTAPDLLTQDEKAILAIAVRLDSALRHLEKDRETVNDEAFIDHVNDELVRRPNSLYRHLHYPEPS